MPRKAQNSPTFMLPTMGVAQNTYRMLCNVLSSRGKMIPRPRIVATETGYSSMSVGSDNMAFGPQWRVHSVTDADTVVLEPPGGIASNGGTFMATLLPTSGEIQKVGTNNATVNITSSSIDASNGLITLNLAASHLLSVGDKVFVYQADTGAAGPGVGEHEHTRTLNNIPLCLEGIDCEIIQGKIVSVFVGNNNSATDTSLYFYHTYNYPGDPRMGIYMDQTVFGSKKDDSPSHWYQQASYWTKRIIPTFSDYMITGYNVGPHVVGGLDPDTGQLASINDGDSVTLFSGFPLKMMGSTLPFHTIARADPYSSFYTLNSPKNAFAHMDRHSGQAIWYGFIDGDRFNLTGELPAELALIMAYDSDITASRATVIARPHHIWYSEPASPLSLSIAGWYPLFVGSLNMEIVGLADYQNGTAIFSHDAIHFMRGIGSDVGSNAATRGSLHSGIGSDSRWSIKAIGDGVAFANKIGLWYLGKDGMVREIAGFKELFSAEGVDCSRGPYHEYFGDVGSTPANSAAIAAGTVADYAYNRFDSHPWRTIKIDKDRLDRAVAGVWDDLYLLFVSMDGDEYGDDNRLCLCWNWKESGAKAVSKTPWDSSWEAGPTSIWILPKNMGVRGWAYDGSLETPFVMTRYGLAKFEKAPGPDVVWKNTGPTESNGSTVRVPEHHPAHDINATDGYGHLDTINPIENFPIFMGQSHWTPESGDKLVTTNVIVQHETKNDTLGSAEAWTDALSATHTYNGASPTSGCVGGDTDGKMRVRIWAMQGEMLQSKGNFEDFPFSKMRLTKSDIDPLENLVSRSDFKLWRGRHARHSAITWGPLDTEGTVRLPKGIRRASSARSGFTSSRCVFQFSTANPDTILSLQVMMEPTAPRGEGA